MLKIIHCDIFYSSKKIEINPNVHHLKTGWIN